MKISRNLKKKLVGPVLALSLVSASPLVSAGPAFAASPPVAAAVARVALETRVEAEVRGMAYGWGCFLVEYDSKGNEIGNFMVGWSSYGAAAYGICAYWKGIAWLMS